MAETSTEPAAAIPGPTSAGDRPKPPRVWTVSLAFGIGLLGPLVLGLLEGSLLVAREVVNGRPVSNPTLLAAEIGRLLATPTFLLINATASLLLFAGLAIGCATRSPTPWLIRLRAAKSSLAPTTLVVATATFLTLSFGIGAVLNLLHLGQSGALKMFADAFKGASPGVLLLGVLILGVGTGICEEALFRGYIQTRLVERWGRWPGILLTATCFALVHYDVAQGLFAFLVGIFLGWLTARAGSIRPAMLVHAINNSISVLLSAGGEAPSEIPSATSWMVILVLFLLMAGGVACLARRLPVGNPVADRGVGGCL